MKLFNRHGEKQTPHIKVHFPTKAEQKKFIVSFLVRLRGAEKKV